ncbi:MAG: hypothetical protein F9K10_03285 [Paludibacter sp.]|nr:MAG: hypothetical protein F9K10_03285 [Paludibacter sp.]
MPLRGLKVVQTRFTVQARAHTRVATMMLAPLLVGMPASATPRYTDAYGLAAVEVTKEKIEVRELKAGTGTYEFDYFITAKRAGFESHEPIQPNTHFTADMMTKDDFENAYAKTDDVTVSAMRTLLISNGILTREGKLNTETAKKLGWNVKAVEVARNEPRPDKL